MMKKFGVRFLAAVGTVAVAGCLSVFGAGSASASGYGVTPEYGDLCSAAEPIFVSSGGSTYTVPQYEFIRITQIPVGSQVVGRSPNHSEGSFVWRHANGNSRLYNCH